MVNHADLNAMPLVRQWNMNQIPGTYSTYFISPHVPLGARPKYESFKWTGRGNTRLKRQRPKFNSRKGTLIYDCDLIALNLENGAA